MVDYELLRANSWKLPEPEPAEEQEGQQPVVVDLVYNTYQERNGKTIAVTVSLRLPNACRCPHCEAAAQFPGRSGNHHKTE